MLRALAVCADGLVSSGGNERDRWEAYCLVQAAVSGNLLLADWVRVDMNVVLMFAFTHTKRLSCSTNLAIFRSSDSNCARLTNYHKRLFISKIFWQAILITLVLNDCECVINTVYFFQPYCILTRLWLLWVLLYSCLTFFDLKGLLCWHSNLTDLIKVKPLQIYLHPPPSLPKK